jgi:uncharacterized repeat protein (TIGR03803 family)
MTEDGGTANKGTIFQIGTDGTGFSLLHSFAGGSADGSFPQGSLILSGSTLYGTTANGGSASKGTLFKIDTNGTGFSLVHSFSGGANDGSNPQDAPILIGSTLYGMTNAGGSVDAGTIYQIATNGTGLSLLHTFTGTAGDGYYPLSSLIQSGPILYGMTSSGPAGSGNGVVFSLSLVTGDYDGNGSVDAADYVVWRKTDGSAGGYNTWRANFGKPFGSGSLADGTIPEPTSLALAAFVLVGGLLGLSRRAGRQKSA